MDSDDNNGFLRFVKTLYNLVDGPVEYVRETLVKPNQKKYPFYHQQFRRVPTIDECYEWDIACRIEAQKQFERDKLVDDEVLSILRQRYEDCAWYYGEDKDKFCTDLNNIYKEASAAWFTKYGDIGVWGTVYDAFMKQKHRMVWERRHGPVGQGRTNKKFDYDD